MATHTYIHDVYAKKNPKNKKNKYKKYTIPDI